MFSSILTDSDARKAIQSFQSASTLDGGREKRTRGHCQVQQNITLDEKTDWIEIKLFTVLLGTLNLLLHLYFKHDEQSL